MKTFIFYSLEGYTESPSHNLVENCQLSGEADGENAEEALANLLKDNTWIKKSGFRVNAKQIIARELANNKCFYL